MSLSSSSTMVKQSTRPLDIDDSITMPPPAKRVKSVPDTMTEKDGMNAAPVSPEQKDKDAPTTQESNVVKRRSLHSSSPTETTQHQGSAKRVKSDDSDVSLSPTTPRTTTSTKVDPTVFASAFALASLALSPQQEHHQQQQQQAYGGGVPYSSPHAIVQTREDDMSRMEENHYAIREPSSPNRPVVGSGGGDGGGGGYVPITPDGAMLDAQRRRRVKFANRMKTARPIPGGRTSTIPPPYGGRPMMGAAAVPNNRMVFRHGPVFRQTAVPYPKRHSYWPQDNSGCGGGGAAMATTTPWQVPSSSMMANSLAFAPPPPPPPPSQGKEWICDFCHVASFATYEEACAHESTCRLRLVGPGDRKVMCSDPITHRDDHHSSVAAGAAALYDRSRGIERREKNIVPEQQDSNKYFAGCISLSVPSADSEWLSELNCFVRESCVEAFSATEDDISRASKRGRIVLHQVGIRCKFCAFRDPKDKAVAAVSYPTTVSGIYESVKRWQRVHQSVCQDVPPSTREHIEKLQNTSVWVPTTRQYWADSARALGMTDTHHGIRFERPPSAPEGWVPDNHTESSATAVEENEDSGEDAGYIALPCDKDDIPEYVYFLMRQVESCRYTEADRFVARSKGPVGFAGFQCRHCSGHAGLGKYFPLTTKSLATNSTSQNIHAHLLKCRKCSPQVKETLVRLKSEKGKSPRLVPGWRREFFDRVWERLHGEAPKH